MLLILWVARWEAHPGAHVGLKEERSAPAPILARTNGFRVDAVTARQNNRPADLGC